MIHIRRVLPHRHLWKLARYDRVICLRCKRERAL